MEKIKSALAYLESIKKEVKKSELIFLFLDYDGTLTEIRSRPAEAIPGKDLIGLLNGLLDSRFIITIISGRSLDDLKKMIKEIKLKGINLVGSHGSEIQLANSESIIETDQGNQLEEKQAVDAVKKLVIPRARKIKNILIEEKPISLAIHYRNIPEEESIKIEELVDYIDGLKKRYDFRYMALKKLIEIMPSYLNKGMAIKKITDSSKNRDLKKGKNLVICIGDDVTDEDLFLANKSGVNIKVKHSPGQAPDSLDTEADYYLGDPGEVIYFLKNIIN